MSVTRRDFMKLFGVSVASLLLNRCQAFLPTPTCYAPLPPPTVTPPITASSARERLRLAWLGFEELARRTFNGKNADNALGQQMIAEHRAALDETLGGPRIHDAHRTFDRQRKLHLCIGCRDRWRRR